MPTYAEEPTTPLHEQEVETIMQQDMDAIYTAIVGSVKHTNNFVGNGEDYNDIKQYSQTKGVFSTPINSTPYLVDDKDVEVVKASVDVEKFEFAAKKFKVEDDRANIEEEKVVAKEIEAKVNQRVGGIEKIRYIIGEKNADKMKIEKEVSEAMVNLRDDSKLLELTKS